VRFLRPLVVVDHRTAPEAVRAAVDEVVHPRAAYDLIHACPHDPVLVLWCGFIWVPPCDPGQAEVAGDDLLRRVASELPEQASIRTTLLPASHDPVARVRSLVETCGHDIIVAPPCTRRRMRRWLARQSLAPVVWAHA
jgi:hypothetical protein